MKNIIFFTLVFILTITLSAQSQLEKQLRGYNNPDELVSLSENIQFDQAIEILSSVSEKLSGKKIVSLTGLTTPIGIAIDKMPYLRALKIIVQYNNLLYEEKKDVIIVRQLTDDTQALGEDIYASIEEREVKITALFFEANVIEMSERGINWQFILQKGGITIGSDLTTFGAGTQASTSLFTPGGTTTQQTTGSSTQNVKTPDFQVGTKTKFEMGDFVGDALGIFKFFESENLGEIISRPSISVRNKTKGRIQIGSDISIKQRDFSGNVIEQFQPTGTIIDVQPYIYNEENIDYVLLKLNLERSSAIVGDITTEIAKTMANADVLLLDGEETVIGGLYINEEVTVRRGVPLLKDLPWWFFGLRYIFGYDSEQITKKEVIILIKAELLPTLKERVDQKKENLIRSKFLKDEAEGEQYKMKNFLEELKKNNEDADNDNTDIEEEE